MGSVRLGWSVLAGPLVLAVALASAACGDPLVDGDFEGDPRISINALVCCAGDMDMASPVQPTMGILWKWNDGSSKRIRVGQATTLGTVEVPAVFEIEIFDAPPVETSLTLQTSAGEPVLADLGCPVVFDDVDRDGEYGSDDVLLAVSWNHLLVNVRDDHRAPQGSFPVPFLGAPSELRPGYQVVKGICDEEGHPSGMKTVAADNLIDISLFASPGEWPAVPPVPSCVGFF